jgi:acyl carrier protein
LEVIICGSGVYSNMNVANSPVLFDEQVLDKIKLIIEDLLQLEGSEEITESSRLKEDLGIDSLGFVDFIVVVEENFAVRFPSTVNPADLQTLGDAVKLIMELSAEQK